ncbi:MAG: META domain-containing protein [Muribaculaceae bacterium]|nr:META domain-containing protein [Muribaculaceae bacterium]
MKNLIYIGIGLMAVAATATGCSSINSLLGRKDNTIRKESVLPSDREEIQLQAKSQEYTSEDLARGTIKGDWAIEQVNGQPTVGVKPPFLKFVPSEKRVYGNNGCNVINANYQYNPADSTLTFSNLASTMMMCNEPGLTDIDINSALGNVARYTWERKGNEYYLYLTDVHLNPVLVLMHQNFEFLNGSWQVLSIGDEAIDNPDVKLVIDVDEYKIHGNTGCNIFNGSFEIDRETANVISFQDLITTRMACPNPEYETRFLVALEDADHAKPISGTRVLLLNSSNEVVMTLERITE